jgi:RNA recognition motif-containing protein
MYWDDRWQVGEQADCGLIVSKLGALTDEDDVRRLLERFGDVLYVKVRISMRGNKYAKAIMRTREQRDKAVANLDGRKYGQEWLAVYESD